MGKRNEYGDDAKHFKDVSALKATCIYCNTTINGGAERRRCHLARFKGRGVSVCTKVPVEVREQMLELQRKHLTLQGCFCPGYLCSRPTQLAR